jgi:hypothetical protein
MTTAVERAPVTAPVTVADLVAAVRDQQVATAAQVHPAAAPTGTGTVLVLGAHGGAGASTVAVALADAVADAGEGLHVPVRVIDLAAPADSGVAPATRCEVGSEYPGWRAGRRDLVRIYSPRFAHATAASIPDLPIAEVGHTILDLGRPWSPRTTIPWDRATRTVLVCRATVPGLRHAERILAELSGDVILAAVGARRWPSDVLASFGPHIAAVVDNGRCVLVPTDRRLERRGLDSTSLSKPIAAAARRLAEMLWPSLPPGGTHR